jgi:hypothetical protein
VKKRNCDGEATLSQRGAATLTLLCLLSLTIYLITHTKALLALLSWLA